ncbi:SRPBCC family protein [Streptomyces sp. NPDC007818]|uniref:SRPBCC family protein n=1 Tax=Streptomyces sp. NPDC007818 TaxID=3364780 RepID=UPI00369C974C
MDTSENTRSGTRNRSGSGGSSGLDQLMSEFSRYAAAQADQLAQKAGDKLDGLTDQLYDVADNGGDLAGLGSRVLGGDSPLKAVAGQALGKAKDKVTDVASQVMGKGKGKGRKSGGGKVVNIVEWIDVGLPLRTTYDHWTMYEKFSGFAKGVRDVSRADDTTTDWKMKVGPSSRSWKATVQEQVPDERIVWTSEGAKGTSRGCVSFHELAPSLTRIVVVVEYHPAGLFEKTGNLWRAQGRRLRLDLKHFLRHVALSTDEPDGWRGEIRDGEVVQTHEEALEEEEAEGDGEGDETGEGYEDETEAEAEAEQDDGDYEAGEGAEEEDAEDDEDEEGEDDYEQGEEDGYEEDAEDEEEGEEEPAPARRRR